GSRPGHDQTGSYRDDQRGNLRHDAIADRQQGVLPQSFAPCHALLQNTNDEATDDVDQHDDDPGDRIPLDELAGPIHRAVERGFPCKYLAPPLRLFLIDEAHVQIGVDAHLLARHTVQRETRCHFGHTLSTVGNDNVLDNHQNEEDDQPDNVTTPNDVGAHGRD